MNPTTNTDSRTAAALAARQRTSEAAVQRVHHIIARLRRENAPVSVAAVARRALLTELVVVFVQFSDPLLIESLIRPCRRPQGICRF